MANTLRFKRGLLAGLPSAAVGEPLFTTDTFDLYIGTASGTQKYQKFIASGTTSQLLRGDGSLLTMPIVLSSPANGEVLKYNGTNWVNSSDAGVTGSGTTNYLPRFTGATTLGNSTIFQGTRSLGFNTATPVDFGAGTYNFHLHDNGIPLIQFTNSTTGQSSSVGSRIQLNDNDLLFINSQATGVFRWNTNGAERMRLHSTGNLHLGGTSDNGLRFQVTGDGFFSGSVGIGSTSLTGYGVRNSRTITGALACYGFSIDGTIQSDATSSINIFHSLPATQAATFNIGSLIHFIANQGTQGAGSTISNQYGFLAQAGLTGATNNYGFYGNIASGTGRWNLYMNGTAANYLNGNTGFSSTNPLTKVHIRTGNAASTLEGLRLGNGSNDPNAGNRLSFYFSDNASNIAGAFIDVVKNGSDGNILFLTSAANATPTEKVRFFGDGNVGIATGSTNAGFRLDVNGTMRVTGASTFGGLMTISGSATTLMQITSTGSAAYLGMGDSSGSVVYLGSDDGSFLVQTPGSSYSNKLIINSAGAATFSSSVTATSFNGTTNNIFSTGGTERMRLDASGNLGLGVTPSAWNTSYKAIDIGNVFSLMGASNAADLYGNLFLNTSGQYIYKTTAAGTAYSMAGGQHRWYVVASGTAGNTATLTANMTLGNNGNLLLGSTSDTGERLQVNGTMRVSGATTITGSLGSVQVLASGAELYFTRNGNNDFYANSGSSCAISIGAQNHVRFLTGTTLTERARFDTTGNFSVDSGVLYVDAVNNRVGINDINPDYTLDVNGTMQVIGAATFSSSVTLSGNLTVDTNTFFVDSNNNNVGIGTTTPSYKLQVVGSFGASTSGVTLEYNNGILYHSGSYYQFPSGSYYNLYGRAGMGLIFGSNNAEVGRFDLSGNLGIGMTPSYKLDVTGSARVSDAIAIGTTPDTNLPFKILKNINSTVGIRFENTNTGASAFSAVQFGTDVSGGTKFTNLVYSSSGVIANGVYNPDGTSLINNGAGGLNFLGTPIRFYTGGSNGTLRYLFDNEGAIQYTATTPTTNAVDGYKQYSADITAGNAAPHFRTENGGIIKLYQQTTGVTSATYIGGAGTGLTDSDTYDGYTIAQIVKALRNAGLLA